MSLMTYDAKVMISERALRNLKSTKWTVTSFTTYTVGKELHLEVMEPDNDQERITVDASLILHKTDYNILVNEKVAKSSRFLQVWEGLIKKHRESKKIALRPTHKGAIYTIEI